MSEAAFPLLGALFVVGVILPLAALPTKLVLMAMENTRHAGTLHRLNIRFVLLIGSTFVPLLWFLSAGLHQLESGQSTLSCLINHSDAGPCWEPGLFALTLLTMVVACAWPVVRGERHAHRPISPLARAARQRIETLIDANVVLHGLCRRVQISEDPSLAISTQGLFRPFVLISTHFATRLSDDALVAALCHEAEHVRQRDPLRYGALNLAFAMNPLGRMLLAPHFARWQAARETHCDREAVLEGARPLHLATAIVEAARPRRAEMVALGARDTAILQFRVEMLMAYAEKQPARCCEREHPALPFAAALLMVATILPHNMGTAVLDVIHAGAEYTASSLLP